MPQFNAYPSAAALTGSEVTVLAQNGSTVNATVSTLASGAPAAASWAGSVARTLLARLNDYVNINDFGLARNGTTDDSAGVAAAVAAAIAANVGLYVPAGGPILMGGAVGNIVLANIKIYGDAFQDRGTSIGALGLAGSTFWLTDTSKPTFLLGATGGLGASVVIEGINFWWPNQVQTLSSPIVYPALFSPVAGGNSTAFHMRRCNVGNAYDFINFSSVTATFTNASFEDCQIFALHYCFQLASSADVIQIVNCEFHNGLGNIYGNLATWYNNNGVWCVISGNTTSSGSGGVAINGLYVSNSYVYGCLLVLKVLGGNGTAGELIIASFDACGFDGVQGVLEADQYSSVLNTVFSNCLFYVQKPGGGDSPNGAVYCNQASQWSVEFQNCQGVISGNGFVLNPGTNYTRTYIGGGNFTCIGATSGPYNFLQVSGSTAPYVRLIGVHLNSTVSASNAVKVSTPGGWVQVANNHFASWNASLDIETTAAIVVVAGNNSDNTGAAHDIIGTGTTNVLDLGNAWNKPNLTYNALSFGYSASATDGANLAGGGSGNGFALSSTSPSANANATFITKGSAAFYFLPDGTGTAKDGLIVVTGALGAGPIIRPNTSGTNSQLNLQGAGSGVVAIQAPTSLDQFTVAALPSATTYRWAMVFATNGRNSGEGSGLGTGCPVYSNGTIWIAPWSGVAVTA